jgi:CXXX repeat modification system protein
MNKILGVVTIEEKCQMETIDNRLTTLRELGLSLNKYYIDDEVARFDAKYQEAVKLVNTEKKQWWDYICKKYNWDDSEFDTWTLNFRTNEILVGKL